MDMSTYVDAESLERVAASAGVPSQVLKARAGKYGGLSYRTPRYLMWTGVVVVAVAAAAAVVYWNDRKKKEKKEQ